MYNEEHEIFKSQSDLFNDGDRTEVIGLDEDVFKGRDLNGGTVLARGLALTTLRRVLAMTAVVPEIGKMC